MSTINRYIEDTSHFTSAVNFKSGVVGWSCPSNIALVKYWGKKGNQLPMNPSLSLTLSRSLTECVVNYEYDIANTGSQVEYYFDSQTRPQFTDRIVKFLNEIENILPFLRNTRMVINSRNTFPHSAGIASSASAFGALSLCLLSIAENISGKVIAEKDFLKKASFIARLGSGSASRSVFGTAALWGYTNLLDFSSDEYAVPVEEMIHPVFKTMHDVILIIDDSSKKVSSSEGHKFMSGNPYVHSRIEQANQNIRILLSVLKEGDVKTFVNTVEQEALSLHAMMLTSDPGFFLVKESTIQAIQKIRQFRSDTRIPVSFTLDAGPNIHLLFPDDVAPLVMDFIHTELIQYCGSRKYIIDKVGSGPIRLKP